MAVKAPANDREQLLKLINLVEEQHDLDKLLGAATNFSDWTVLSNDEKREIQRHSCKQRRLNSLVTFIIENGRAARFANFILRYNEPIQAAALALVSRPTVSVASSEMRPTGAAPSPEKILPRPASGGSQKSSATTTSSPMELDTTESPGACSDSMDTDFKDNLMGSQINNILSSGSQKLSDIGYSSGLSKDFQSPNLPVGDASLLTLQSNLEVIKRNHQSRQLKMQQRHLDATKHQHITYFHQPVVVHHHYHIPGKEEQQTKYDDQWPPLLARYSRDIIRSLKMEDLVPHLVEKRLLTKNEYLELDTYPSWKQSEHYVLKILPTKGEDGWKKFLECLKEEKEHSGHQDLFRLLKN